MAYLACYVSEMGYLLSFVFINAWTSQFFVDQTDGLEKAKDLSETILSLSMVIGLVVGGILGHVIDKCQIAPTFILCFLVRGLGLVMMTYFITDFEE